MDSTTSSSSFSIICYSTTQYGRKDKLLLQFHRIAACSGYLHNIYIFMLFYLFQLQVFIKSQMCKNYFLFFLWKWTCKLRCTKMPLEVLVSLIMYNWTWQTFRQSKKKQKTNKKKKLKSRNRVRSSETTNKTSLEQREKNTVNTVKENHE